MTLGACGRRRPAASPCLAGSMALRARSRCGRLRDPRAHDHAPSQISSDLLHLYTHREDLNHSKAKT